MEPTYTIEVDGLPVEVDAAAYEADTEAVIEAVRTARAEVVGDLSDTYEIPPDYDELVAAFGEEG